MQTNVTIIHFDMTLNCIGFSLLEMHFSAFCSLGVSLLTPDTFDVSDYLLLARAIITFVTMTKWA